MTTPQDAPAGPVLGDEDCERIGRDLAAVLVRLDPDADVFEWHRCAGCRQPDQPCPCAGEPFPAATLLDHVAALLSSAREEGRKDGRGDMEFLERKWRAEERERVALNRHGSDEMVSDEMLAQAGRAAVAAGAPGAIHPDVLRAALAVVLPDVEERVRQECAAQIEAELADESGSGWDLAERMHALAHRWTS